MGGTNDAHGRQPIGTNEEYTKALGSKDTTAEKGAWCFLIETLLAWKPTLAIIVMSLVHGNWAYDYPYADAVKEVANYYALPVCRFI